MKYSKILPFVIFVISLLSANTIYGQCAATDVTAPEIICPENVIGLTCNDVVPPGATTVAEFNAIDGTSSATDDCGIETITFVDDPDIATFTFCAADGPFVITRTYTVIDTAGLQASCDQTFTFESDTESPTITNPGNINANAGLVCEDLLDPVALEASQSEGFPTIDDNCNGAVTEAEIAANPDVADGFDENEVISINGFSLSYSDNIIVHPGGICTDPNQRKFRIVRTWTVLDACSNSGTVSQNINVGDNSTAPTPGVVAGDVFFDTDDMCGTEIVAADIEEGSTDNCGDASMDPSTFDVSATALIRIEGSGATFESTITLTNADYDLTVACPAPISIELQVTDECGNTATVIKEVLVRDATDPVIATCPADTILGGCTTDVIQSPLLAYSDDDAVITEMEFTDAGGMATDICGIQTIMYNDSIDQATVGCPNPLLTVLRTYTIIDNCDNTTQCLQTIDIIDTIPPALTCPIDTTANTSGDGLGNCSTVINGIALDVVDTCGFDVTVTYNMTGATTGSGTDDASGTEFLLGETTVTYYAEDCAGNIDSCSFLVTVVDDESPILTCPGDFTVSTDDGTCDAVVEYAVSATDNCSPFVYGNVELLMGIDSAGTFPIGETTVQIRYTDTVGNADTCMFIVNVIDTEAPTVTCPGIQVVQLPANTCDTLFNYIEPTATDNCMSGITVNRLDATGLTPGSLFNIGDYTLIYEFVDGAMNRDTCEVLISIVEFDIPSLINLSELNLSIDETCNGNLTPEMVLLGEELGCLDSCEIIVLDAEGNPRSDQFDGSDIGLSFTYVVKCQDLTSEGIVYIEDKFPPQIACVSDTITCGELIVFPPPVITENCSGAEFVLINETFEDVDCSDPLLQQLVTREYIAVDAAGNESDACTQVLSIQRFDIGTVQAPALPVVQLECGVPYATDANGAPNVAAYGSPRLNGVNLLPNQFFECNLFVTFEDETITTSQNTTSIVRTFTATNWYCGQDTTASFVQIFNISDTQGPSIACPGDLTFSATGEGCADDILLPTVEITDLCNEITSVSVQYEGGFIDGNGGIANLPLGFSNVTYMATDAAGNTNSCTFSVLVADDEQPIPVCEQFTVVSLTNQGTAVVGAEFFDDGSFDPCGEVTIEVRRMNANCDPTDIVFGESVTFCCADTDAEQMVVLRVTDESGNSNECMVSVTVQDKTPPILVQGLPDITVSCEFPFDNTNLDQFGTIQMDVDDIEPILLTAELVQFSGPATDGLVLGNCIELESDDLSFTNINSCGIGEATRIIIFRNAEGLTVVDVQFITFVNPSPFDENDITFPGDISFTNVCDLSQLQPENLPAGFGFPVLVEDGCDQAGYDYEDQVTDFSNGSNACVTITRTFTVIDWCQNNGGLFQTFTGTQTIIVNNTIAPAISGDCSNRTVNSLDPNCGPIFIELTNEASDDCTSDEFLQWSYDIDLFNDGTIDITGTSSVASGTYPVGSHRIDWSVNDGCNNNDNCSYTFTLNNTVLPEPKCFDNLTGDLTPMDTDNDGEVDAEMIFVSPELFDAGSLHACGTPLQLSFSSDVNDVLRTFDCDDIGENFIELWVTDTNGNQDFCITSFIVQDNNDVDICPAVPLTGMLSGQLTTEMDEKIALGVVTLEGAEMTDITEEDGNYEFPDMPLGGAYTVSPYKDIDHLNGITTLDIIMIQKHILGIEPFNTPYKMIAADVNNSQSINGQDIIQIRKLLLGYYNEFPENTSWRFVDAEYTFIDNNNPWIGELPESYVIYEMANSMNIDFRGMKIGDVNNSAQPNQLVGEVIDTRSAENVELIIDNKTMKSGETMWIPVYASNMNNIQGLQLGMAYAQNDIAITDVRSGALALDASNFKIDDKAGMLKMIWTNAQAIDVDQNTVLFELLVESKMNTNLQNSISISDESIRNESYNAGLETGGINLKVRSSGNVPNMEFAQVSIAQNEPNPWVTSTMIEIQSPVDAISTLKVMDVSGKVILTKSLDLKVGMNNVVLNRNELVSTGVLYYEVEINDMKVMKKMILID